MQAINVFVTLADIYSLEPDTDISIRDIMATSDKHQDGLLEALQLMNEDLDTMAVSDIYILYKDDRYPYPELEHYKGKVMTDEQWDRLLNDMEWLLTTLEHKHMSIPRAYINICLHKEEVLSMRQFDAANGGQVPLSTEDLIDYGKDLECSGVIEVPSHLYDYIDWVTLAKDFTQHREMTDPDPYTGEQWFVD